MPSRVKVPHVLLVEDDDIDARALERALRRGGLEVVLTRARSGEEALELLRAHAAELLKTEEPIVLGGDYNVIPRPEDCYDPKAWAEDALFLPQTRSSFRSILHLGLTDAFRALHGESGAYTFWDYQAGRWQNDEGIRIDHLLLSPQAADRLRDCQIDQKPRGQQKASDHTPIWCELAA